MNVHAYGVRPREPTSDHAVQRAVFTLSSATRMKLLTTEGCEQGRNWRQCRWEQSYEGSVRAQIGTATPLRRRIGTMRFSNSGTHECSGSSRAGAGRLYNSSISLRTLASAEA